MSETERPRTVAEAIVDNLASHGVEVAFGIPGVHNLGLWEAARGRDGFEIVGVRHEQAAVYAADGVARQNRVPAAAFTITGPGAANTVGAFGEAASSCSPVVLVATEVALRDRSARSSFGRVHGSPDQGAIFESLAKGVFRIRKPNDVIPMVTEAMQLAAADPQGPVYIDVPTDILSAPVDETTATPAAPVPPAPADLDALIAALQRSERPLLWAGGGAATDQAANVVRQLSERLGAPVITTFAGRGIVTEKDPGWTSLPIHEPDTIDLMSQADLLLGIGSAFDGMNTRNWNLPFPTEFYSVNVAPTHLVEEGVPHTDIRGDAVRAGEELLARLDPTPRPFWADLPTLRQAGWDRLHEHEMQPQEIGVLAAVDEALARGDVVLADMAICGYWTSGYAAPSRPRQLLYPVGWGTLGFALPAAVGAAWQARRRGGRAFVVMGDGGFMFAVGELATIRDHNLPVTILVVDDGGYGMIRYDQVVSGMEQYGTSFWVPDFSAVGTAFGIPSMTVDLDDHDALHAALGLTGTPGDGPRLVHVKAELHPPRTTSPRWRELQVVTAK
ncbi:thiamine pyrophosphate-binding protein [Micromonospora sp. NPDC005161]